MKPNISRKRVAHSIVNEICTRELQNNSANRFNDSVSLYGGIIKEHGAQLNRHEHRLNVHDCILREHGRQLSVHEGRLNQHDVILRQHGVQLKKKKS